MAMTYPKIAIGSVVDLPFTVRNVVTRQLVDLQQLGVTPTCRIASALAPIITDEACGVLSTRGWYRWNTAGLTAGIYRVQFRFPNGVTPAPAIEPAVPIEVELVAGLEAFFPPAAEPDEGGPLFDDEDNSIWLAII